MTDERAEKRETNVYVEIAAPGVSPDYRIHAYIRATCPIDTADETRINTIEEAAKDEFHRQLLEDARYQAEEAKYGWNPDERDQWTARLMYHWVARDDRVKDSDDESTETAADRTAEEYSGYAAVAWHDYNCAARACSDWGNRNENRVEGPDPYARKTMYTIGIGTRPPWAIRIPDGE